MVIWYNWTNPTRVLQILIIFFKIIFLVFICFYVFVSFINEQNYPIICYMAPGVRCESHGFSCHSREPPEEEHRPQLCPAVSTFVEASGGFGATFQWLNHVQLALWVYHLKHISNIFQECCWNWAIISNMNTVDIQVKTSWIRETLNLSAFANSINNTNKSKLMYIYGRDKHTVITTYRRNWPRFMELTFTQYSEPYYILMFYSCFVCAKKQKGNIFE